MATKGKRPMRALTAGDKIEAIQRVNDGESKASVARDIGVPESTLRGWCKNEDKLRYMSSRRSSPDTDKSSDGEPHEKRARTESPVAPCAPAAPLSPAGLDLSAAAAPPPSSSVAPLTAPPPSGVPDQPVELTTRRADHAHTRDRRAAAEPGASVSMSAISPLSGLAHLPGLAHSHLGLSFNDIATNLTLFAQLNPGLSALAAAAPSGRALRSVRSPKPAHNGALNLSDKHRSKPHHADHYADRRSKSNHHGKDTVDDALWYWLKTQQAMLDLTAQTTAAHPMQLGKTADQTHHNAPKPMAPVAPINPHVDYNRNTWFWQYYKQFGGAMPQPEDKLKSASQVPKEKAENILYSQLIKGKMQEEEAAAAAAASRTHGDTHEERTESPNMRVSESAASPGGGGAPPEHREAGGHDRPPDNGRNPAKARIVLDNLLFNNNNNNNNNGHHHHYHHSGPVDEKSIALGAGAGAGSEQGAEWEASAAEALQHGDKFLSWLEGSGDPSVTRMHVHQLRSLLHNLRARRLK